MHTVCVSGKGVDRETSFWVGTFEINPISFFSSGLSLNNNEENNSNMSLGCFFLLLNSVDKARIVEMSRLLLESFGGGVVSE